MVTMGTAPVKVLYYYYYYLEYGNDASSLSEVADRYKVLRPAPQLKRKLSTRCGHPIKSLFRPDVITLK